MTKVMALILTIALLLSLCACGAEPAAPADKPEPAEPISAAEPEEPEITLPDARTAWETAESMEYTSMDLDANTQSKITIGDETIISATDSRVKAVGVGGQNPQYQIVTTGDDNNNCYYGEGMGYFDAGYGSYCQKMTEDEFMEFYNRNSPDILPEYFDTVEYDGDNTAKIVFSGATEEFCRAFLAAAVSAGVQINKDSLSISGSITLDDEGNEKTAELEACMSANVSGVDCDLVISTTETMLSFNSDSISINVPAKLADYIEVNNLSALRTMYEALSTPTENSAVDYAETVEYHLTVGDAAIDEKDYDRIAFSMPDGLEGELRYYEEYSSEYSVNGDGESESYTAEYADGKLHMSYNDGDETDTEIDSATLLVTIVQMMTTLNGQEYFGYYSDIDDGPTSEEEKVITFRASEDIWLYLLDSMLSTYSDEFSGMVYYGTFTEQVNDCIAVIEETTGSLKSFGLYSEFQIDLGDGETVTGSVRYTKEFQAYGSDVFLTAVEEETAA